MADKNNELNLGQGVKPANEKGKGGMKKIIIIVLALLVVGGGAAAYFMVGGDADQPSTDQGDTNVAEAEQSEDFDQDPIYLPLNPAFVVNFEHNGSIRYLQLSLQIMSYEQDAIDKVSNNMPAVRNSLIMLFSGQDYDYLNTVEGKESLRKEVLNSIHQVVRFKNNLKVNDVFFTGFVMQ